MTLPTLPPNRFARMEERLRSAPASLLFLAMIFLALLAFEMFNFSTTEQALLDMLGDVSVLGISWATVLAIAFCGVDFAGVARLFMPDAAIQESKEVWYMFGAWVVAATINALLTWWGVSIAIHTHGVKSATGIIDAETLLIVVPVFVAVMVWIIRVLIIGTLALAVDRLMRSPADAADAAQAAQPSVQSANVPSALRRSPVSMLFEKREAAEEEDWHLNQVSVTPQPFAQAVPQPRRAAATGFTQPPPIRPNGATTGSSPQRSNPSAPRNGSNGYHTLPRGNPKPRS